MTREFSTFILFGTILFATAPWLIGQEIDRYPLNEPGKVAQLASFNKEPAVEASEAIPVFQKTSAASFVEMDPREIKFNSVETTGPQPVAAQPVSAYFQAHVPKQISFQTSLQLPPVTPVLAVSASQTSSSNALLDPYHGRAEQYRRSHVNRIQPNSIPTAFSPWWGSGIASTLAPSRTQLPISLDMLIQSALRNSPHIQVAATEPHIRNTSVFEEASEFDWLSFLETKYDDTNDPIGNELTTGDRQDRFEQQEFYSRGGLRRKTNSGSELELSQRLGYLDNNSRFLVPPNQGNSRIELSYRHPLLRGQGHSVNQSLILLAQIDFHSASDDFLGKLQSHLSDITATYWELVRARAQFMQRAKLLQSAELILDNLNGRVEVDALDRQVYRAKAAVAKRRAEISRSVTSIQNAESRLKLLVNEPQLQPGAPVELVPMDLPSNQPMHVEIADAVSTALLHRPDISKAIREVSSANVRLGVAKNEILPKLDLLVGSYIAGLDGDSDTFNSWVNQFRDGRPGFNVGFEFEIPLGNRGALARQERREWELKRMLHQFRVVVETGITEVEIAAREVQTAHQEVGGRYHAMVAAANETSFLIDRWKTLPGVDDSVTLLLEDLLDSQERQADEEAAYSQAQFDLAVATVKLKQAMGTLFQVNGP